MLNKSKQLTIILLIALLAQACTKQTPEMQPGQALIQNIKTSLTVAGVAIATTRAALPAFKLDAEDMVTANAILDDILTARDSFKTRLEPYTAFDASNRDSIIQAAKDAIATLKDLHDKKLDRVKNPKAREQVSAALDALQTVLNLVFEQQPQPVKIDV